MSKGTKAIALLSLYCLLKASGKYLNGKNGEALEKKKLAKRKNRRRVKEKSVKKHYNKM